MSRRSRRPRSQKENASLGKTEIGVYNVVNLCVQVTSKRSVLAALSEITLEHLQCIYIFAMKESNMHINDRVFSII